ncbi:MAG: anti-phage-associated DUF1156 domain-containing protein [Pseudomonadota bacterium]
MPKLTPHILHDAPALIESVFPAQKVSFEAQRERNSGSSQTLTSIGMFWKGRKPLILVRAIVLGSLLPQTDDAGKDLEIFEKLMAFDEEGLARRALIEKKLKPKEIAARIELDNPWEYFTYSIKNPAITLDKVNQWSFPLDCDLVGIVIRWQRDLNELDKIEIYKKALNTINSYEEKASLCKRPEKIDPKWLYEEIWTKVNQHYAYYGINAHSHQDLVEQLGILRYGHNPIVGDTFSGGGSIPFEAARLGCDVYASDLNPIACMLTWGALNIIGASPKRRTEIGQVQREVAAVVDHEVTALGIEHDGHGNRSKVYLYCLEIRCPETGWMVPMSQSWVISKSRKVVAKLIPDHNNRRFAIEVATGVSAAEMETAFKGTVQDGALVYELDGKRYNTPIKTLRGDYRDAEGNTQNRLRRWDRQDFKPAANDIFQERLYAIQWITKETQLQSRQEKTFFTSVTEEDLRRERRVEEIVEKNLEQWQDEGLVPDMAIEPGDKTNEPIRTRGWTYWHHLFNARGLLTLQLLRKRVDEHSWSPFLGSINHCSKLCYWATSGKRYSKTNPDQQTGGASDNSVSVFVNQALNTFYNYSQRAFSMLDDEFQPNYENTVYITANAIVKTLESSKLSAVCDIFITDPPYADAVHYHEITEFFIAWLRKNPPAPFDQWTWDSRRALAIKGSGDDFRRDMVDAYRAMTEHMPDNGMQCVMFTHQDTGVWSDMVGIFWAAGLQVVSAWYIATETTSELKKGGYVQGTVILMLRKRPVEEKSGFKQRILPAVRNEVKRQIEQMMHLNEDVEDKLGEPVFNDSDLQMAGYAAALKVLTAYTSIGGEDVTTFALRPRKKGEVTVVDEIVQQAAEAANSLLVPEGLAADTWQRISGIQRFYLRMMDMETSGASKLDNYQNFAKAFRVEDYTKVMGNMKANKARLKGVQEFSSRELTDSTEFGATWLGRLTIGLQQLLTDTEPQIVVSQLQAELPDFMEIRLVLIDILHFMQNKSPDEAVRGVSEILANRLQNQRALGQ